MSGGDLASCPDCCGTGWSTGVYAADGAHVRPRDVFKCRRCAGSGKVAPEAPPTSAAVRLEQLRLMVRGCLDDDSRPRCEKMLRDHEELFAAAQGSSHNHQAWAGGYADHVVEVMKIARVLYPTLSSVRRLPFSLPDAMLVLFLHDLEKPWKGRPDFATKEAKRAHRDATIADYGFRLSDAQRNALEYVEGEREDYRSDRRVMGELAAFCHACDVLSARLWHDQPKRGPSPWTR